MNRTWALKTEPSGFKCQLARVLEQANLNSSLGFCEPSFPALAGFLSGLNSLTFSKHLVNVTMSEGLLINFYPKTELFFFFENVALFYKKWFYYNTLPVNMWASVRLPRQAWGLDCVAGTWPCVLTLLGGMYWDPG